MSGSLIGRFEHLAKRPRSDEARPLLEKIASQVKPIMSKRGWKVGTLAEFLPSNPALLGNNMNAGQRINLRLRPPGNISTFYEYDQLVLVMLHELTHIEHGPHDAKFYKLLAELEEEYYDLKRKGYSGEGFHGAGNHLSGFKVPEYVGKAKGLAAAQKRLDVQRKIGKGGVLGGSAVDGRSMKEVLAEAAERRIRDDKACHPEHAGHAAEVEAEIRKAQEESVGIDAIDLTSDHEDEPNSDAGPSRQIKVKTEPIDLTGEEGGSTSNKTPNGLHPISEPSSQNGPIRPVNKINANTNRNQASAALRNPLTPQINNQAKPRPTHPTKSHTPQETHWPCPTCTLNNPLSSLTCEACATARPPRKGDGQSWYCEFCGSGPRDMGFWSCAVCGWVRKWG